ncbi:MAG: formyl transferase [Endozoicomonas sp.]
MQINKQTKANTKKLRVIMLCGQGVSSRIMYNGIKDDVDCAGVILEESTSALVLAKQRVIRLGYLRTLGQIAFVLLNKILFTLDKSEIKKIISQLSLSDEHFDDRVITRIPTINSEAVVRKIIELSPDLIIVNGTRIIGKKLLERISVPIINTHMGITPRYRGVHGGYWAIANNDDVNCGVTIHLVDEGIDTGDVLYQAKIESSEKDTFNTYPIRQIAAAIPLMKKVIRDVSLNNLKTTSGITPSQLWHHPTIWQYLYYWSKNGCR